MCECSYLCHAKPAADPSLSLSLWFSYLTLSSCRETGWMSRGAPFLPHSRCDSPCRDTVLRSRTWWGHCLRSYLALLDELITSAHRSTKITHKAVRCSKVSPSVLQKWVWIHNHLSYVVDRNGEILVIRTLQETMVYFVIQYFKLLMCPIMAILWSRNASIPFVVFQTDFHCVTVM